MAEQARLDVLGPKRLPKQRIVLQIDLTDGEIVRGAKVRVDASELVTGWILVRHSGLLWRSFGRRTAGFGHEASDTRGVALTTDRTSNLYGLVREKGGSVGICHAV